LDYIFDRECQKVPQAFIISSMPESQSDVREGMFRDERQNRTQKTRGVIYALIISFFAVAILWFLFFSGYFSVKESQIGPLTVIDRQAVAGEIEAYFNQPKQWPWSRRNIFTLNAKDLENYLKQKFFVEDVSVDKLYPNILRLKIKERQRSVILVTNNNIYIVDDYGVVSDPADSATVSSTRKFLTSSVPVETSKEIYILTATSTVYQKGQEVVSMEQVRGWLNLAAKLRYVGIWFKALEPQTDDVNLIKIVLKENKRVLMDMGLPIESQIETLRQFILSKPKWEDINDYIDVRVQGRIYYK